LRGDGWRRYPLHVQALYAALLPIRDGFLLGVVGGDGLRVTRLGFDGAASSFRLVASANRADFNYPFLMTSDSDIVATWVDGVGVGKSRIRVARSSNGGETWRERAPLSVDHGIESFDAVDRDGATYVAGRQSTDGGPWPFAAELKGDQWRLLPIPRLSREVGIVPPRFSRRADEVALYWALDEKGRMNREPPALVRVTLKRNCRG
jgi:hypothetical protein